MALTQQQLEEIYTAQKQALEALNTPTETVYPIERNLEIARDTLIKQGVPVTMWGNVSIWMSAFVGCRADESLVKRPTRAELEAQYHANDRRDGRVKRVGIEPAQRDDPRKVVRDMLQDIIDGVSGKSKSEANEPVEAVEVQWPSLDSDYEQLAPEEQKKFRALSSDQMKMWLRRRAEAKHRERYGDNPSDSVRA